MEIFQANVAWQIAYINKHCTVYSLQQQLLPTISFRLLWLTLEHAIITAFVFANAFLEMETLHMEWNFCYFSVNFILQCIKTMLWWCNHGFGGSRTSFNEFSFRWCVCVIWFLFTGNIIAERKKKEKNLYSKTALFIIVNILQCFLQIVCGIQELNHLLEIRTVKLTMDFFSRLNYL